MRVTAIILFILSAFSGFAQEANTTVEDFEIKFEYHYNKVFLTASNGTNWLELQFNFFPNEDAKLIDNVGVSTYSDELFDKLKGERTFIFTLKRTKDGFALVGLKGTAWKDLSFSCDENYCKRTLTERGVELQ